MNAWWPKHAIQRGKMHEGNVTSTWYSQMFNMKIQDQVINCNLNKGIQQ